MDIFDEYEKKNSYEKFAPVMSMGENKVENIKNPDEKTDIFDQVDANVKNNYVDKEESWPKWFVRTAMQIPKGIAQAETWPADLFNAVAYGAAVDPSEVYDLQRAHERLGLPFNEEEYLNAAGKIAQNFPTVGNLSRIAEEKTGIPLEAKDKLQKSIEFASMASKLVPKGAAIRPFNTTIPSPVVGSAIAGASQLAQAAGIPEPIADIASFAIAKTPTAGAGKISVGAKKKPSGLTERQFENLKKSKNVSEGTINQIQENAEKEFRDITESIIEKTPLKETRNSLKAESDFKSNVSNQFARVHELATEMPGKIVPQDILDNIRKEFRKARPKGYALSEYETELLKHTSDIPKGIFKDEISTVNLVDQYRKNNKAFSQLTEPGKSFAYNQAKRDALQVHNKAIADAIEQMHPNSEMANLFQETNEQWSKIMDSESIDNFLDDLFKGKIQFKKGKDFLNKAGVKEKFNKALGKEGTAQFETLINDLMSYEQGLKFLKKAQANGWKDVATTSLAYMWSPAIGKAKFAYSLLKHGYKTIYEAFLKSPKIGITWDRAVNAAKAGNYKAAQEGFKKVEDVIKTIHPDEVKKAEAGKPATKETINAKGQKINRLTPDEILQRRKANRPARIGKDIEAKGKIIPETKMLEHLSVKPSEVLAREEIGMTPRLARDIEAKGSVTPERKQLEHKATLPTRNEPAQIQQLAAKQKQPRREQKPPIQTPSVIEMALEKHLPKKQKVKRPSKEKSGINKEEVETYTKNKIREDIKRPDITARGLKTQKKFILDTIDETLANFIPSKEKVTINVPGDGVFNINNDERALRNVKEAVKKNWPETPVKSAPQETIKKKPLPKEKGKEATREHLKTKWQKLNDDGKKILSKIEKIGKEVLGREKRFNESWKEYVGEIGRKSQPYSKDVNQLFREFENIIHMRDNYLEMIEKAKD